MHGLGVPSFPQRSGRVVIPHSKTLVGKGCELWGRRRFLTRFHLVRGMVQPPALLCFPCTKDFSLGGGFLRPES